MTGFTGWPLAISVYGISVNPISMIRFLVFLVGHHLAVTIFRTPKVHHTHIVTLLPAPRCLLSNVAMNIGNNLTSSEYSACETVAGMPIVTEKFCLWVLLRPSQLVLNRPSLYSRMRSLSDSIAASNGSSAVCSSGLNPSAFSGFILRTLHPRNLSP